MALTFGFYNSIGGDRKYNAEEMSAIFDGLINDGVFNTIGELFATIPGNGLQVIVKTGKAWFNSTWTLNDTPLPLNLTPPDVTLKRYDAVVLEVNKSEETRANSIKIITGSPASVPAKPVLVETENIHQHPLAYILVEPGITSIAPSKIEIVVGQAECPFVNSIVESVPIVDLLAQWDGEFTEWFDDLQAQLEGDVATNLQNQINDCVKVKNKASLSNLNSPGASNVRDKWVNPPGVAHMIQNEHPIGSIKIDARASMNGYLLCNGAKVSHSSMYTSLLNTLTYSYAMANVTKLHSEKVSAIHADRIYSASDAYSDSARCAVMFSFNRNFLAAHMLCYIDGFGYNSTLHVGQPRVIADGMMKKYRPCGLAVSYSRGVWIAVELYEGDIGYIHVPLDSIDGNNLVDCTFYPLPTTNPIVDAKGSSTSIFFLDSAGDIFICSVSPGSTIAKYTYTLHNGIIPNRFVPTHTGIGLYCKGVQLSEYGVYYGTTVTNIAWKRLAQASGTILSMFSNSRGFVSLYNSANATYLYRATTPLSPTISPGAYKLKYILDEGDVVIDDTRGQYYVYILGRSTYNTPDLIVMYQANTLSGVPQDFTGQVETMESEPVSLGRMMAFNGDVIMPVEPNTGESTIYLARGGYILPNISLDGAHAWIRYQITGYTP